MALEFHISVFEGYVEFTTFYMLVKKKQHVLDTVFLNLFYT